VLAALVGGAVLAACGGGGGSTTSSTPQTNAQTQPTQAVLQRGARLFTQTCASCHALAAAHSTATIGPSLDYVQPTVAQVEGTIASGMRGSRPGAVMPPGLLRGQDAEDVAAYVSEVANRRNVRPNPHMNMNHQMP
jgi:mono/diheme cytochrome c family protein